MIRQTPGNLHRTRQLAANRRSSDFAVYPAAERVEIAKTTIRRRQLPPPRLMTGNERRWINPNKGLVKIVERYLDLTLSRFIYPHLSAVWNPYSWLLERRFCLAQPRISPPCWPHGLSPLKVLLISDIHAGIFLKSETLAHLVEVLMESKPDLVAIAGDLVTGHSREVHQVLGALAPLAAAPLGAWFCFGNHDYFGGDPQEIEDGLRSVKIETLKNASVKVNHGGRSFVLGGVDDPIMGQPDWQRLMSTNGAPHLLLAHNPDHFYNAQSQGVALILSGHTHGGQIRLPHGPPIIRHSRYCLDEGTFAFRSSLLVVSRGLGCVALPWRWGADPEAILIEIIPPQ